MSHFWTLVLMLSLRLQLAFSFSVAPLSWSSPFDNAVVPACASRRIPSASASIMTLYASSSSSAAQPDISKMSPSDMRKELESYGISTKSFLEKKDLVDALEKARSSQGSNTQPPATPSTVSATSDDSKSRAERIKDEMTKANGMKVGVLKKELEERGISTKSFFEKTEFVKAYAEAVVDNVSKKGGTGTSSGSTTRNTAKQAEEPFDPSYRDVTMQKFNGRDPRLLSGVVIDVRLAN